MFTFIEYDDIIPVKKKNYAIVVQRPALNFISRMYHVISYWPDHSFPDPGKAIAMEYCL